MNSKLRDFLLVFNTIISSLLLLVLFFGGLIYADTNGIWHRAEDVIAGTFGADENGGDYIFPNDIEVKNDIKVDNNICLGGQCHNDWSKVCEQWVLDNSIN